MALRATMADLIVAYLHSDDLGVRAALADALAATGPVVHRGMRWHPSPVGGVFVRYGELWAANTDVTLALRLGLPLAADTPIPD